MKSFISSGLLSLFLLSSSSTQEINFLKRNLESRITYNLDFSKKEAIYYVPRNELVNTLARQANEDEFSVAYYEDEGKMINLIKKREKTKGYIDMILLDSLIKKGKRFRIIHNHNNRDLDLKALEKNIPFYWVGPSLLDLGQYLEIGPAVDYSIVTEHGMLTLSTSKETWDMKWNQYFGRVVRSEAERLQFTLEGVKDLDGIKTWAKEYKGIFSLEFEPVTLKR